MQTTGRTGRSRARPDGTAGLVRGLGMFSLALGATQVTAPEAVARLAGIRGDRPAHRATTMAYGVRELVQGAGILGGRGTTAWVRSRVAGDVLDVATLLRGATRDGASRRSAHRELVGHPAVDPDDRYLTMRADQCDVHRYMPKLLEHIRRGDIDPSFVITHRLPLGEAPQGYRTFLEKADGCEKVVLTP